MLSNRSRTGVGLLFVTPWLVGFVGLVVFPFVCSFVWSFCDYDLMSPPTYVGAKHYQRLADELVHGEGFGLALWNTAYFAFLAVPLSIVLAIFLAVILSWRVRGQAVLRSICYLPSILPVVVMSILWMWMLDPIDGCVNHWISIVGCPTPGWFADYREAAWLPAWFQGDGGVGSKDALVLMALWGVGNFMIIYMAALVDVPDTLQEAAMLDGASRVARFRHVTLPMLSPVILFNLMTGIIRSVQAFTQMYLVSEGTGAPQQSTLVLSMHIFLSAFQDLDMGYASAMAWIVFLILLVATWAILRVSRDRVHYSGTVS